MNDDIINYFEVIPIEQLKDADLDIDTIIDSLSILCSMDQTSDIKEKIKLFKDKYNDIAELIDFIDLNIKIFFLRDKFDLDELINYFTAIETETYDTIILDLIKYSQHNANAGYYLELMDKIFPGTTDETMVRDMIDYLDSISEAVNDQNAVNVDKYINKKDNIPNLGNGIGINSMREYYNNLLIQVAEYADTPNYVSNYEIEDNEITEIKKKELMNEPSDRDLAEYVFKFLDISNIELDVENPIDRVEKLINNMYIEEKREYSELFKLDDKEIQRVQDDEILFKLFGPVNIYADTNFNVIDKDTKYGGARMFLDMLNEVDEDDEVPNTWFTGYCQYCYKKIYNIKYAVRKPNIKGGWNGCFCSFDHVIEDIKLYMNTIENIDNNTEYNNYIVLKGLVEEFKEQVENIGIDDTYDIQGYI